MFGFEKSLFLFATLFLASFTAQAKSFNLMAPLIIQSENDWQNFRSQLQKAKSIGVESISTDVWWGLVEPEDQKFDFKYYDRLSNEIIQAGLKWMPIISTHQCGGNVGDECAISIPSWLWIKYSADASLLKYKSSQGNTSNEVISAWGTEIALRDYQELYEAFAQHFKSKWSHISEINLSLGPAGELRYPSYNSHDQGTGYPFAGALQSFSELAIKSLQKNIQKKYITIEALNNAWGFQLSDWNQIYPPTGGLNPFTAYGKDFFDWYHESLLQHGDLLMSLARQSFKNVQLGAKVPGIHWRMASDRLAEVNAGLLSTRDDLAFQHTNDRLSPLRLGYDKTVQLFARNAFILHFTCLEMSNYENQDSHQAWSLAETMVFLVAAEASRQNVKIMGENALSGSLYSEKAWNNLSNVLRHSTYEGLTLLRINAMNEYSWDKLAEHIQKLK